MFASRRPWKHLRVWLLSWHGLARIVSPWFSDHDVWLAYYSAGLRLAESLLYEHGDRRTARALLEEWVFWEEKYLNRGFESVQLEWFWKTVLPGKEAPLQEVPSMKPRDLEQGPIFHARSVRRAVHQDRTWAKVLSELRKAV